jgi:hypothetical protein
MAFLLLRAGVAFVCPGLLSFGRQNIQALVAETLEKSEVIRKKVTICE